MNVKVLRDQTNMTAALKRKVTQNALHPDREAGDEEIFFALSELLHKALGFNRLQNVIEAGGGARDGKEGCVKI